MIKRSASRLLWFGRTRFEQMSRLDLHSSTVHTARHNLSRKPLKVIVSKPDLPIDTLRNSYSDYDELIDLQSVDQSSNIQNPNTSNNDAKRNVYLPKIEQLKDNKKFV